MGEEYTIKLKENSDSYSLCVPKNCAHSKVKLELEHMELLGVVSKVEL